MSKRKQPSAFLLAAEALIRDMLADRARASFKVIDGGGAPADKGAAFHRLGRQLATTPTPEGFAWVARLLHRATDPAG
jgi:hypothetical protein